VAVVTPVRIRDWTSSFWNAEILIIVNCGKSEVFQHDSLAERSKAPDSSSGGAIRVGSNPTAVILSLTEL
jgi:hypothetical protein